MSQVKEITDEIKMTRAELARINRVSYRTAQNWYQGRSAPPQMVILYLEFLRLDHRGKEKS